MRRVTGGARTYDLWAFAGGRFILGSVVLRSFRQQAIAYALSEYSDAPIFKLGQLRGSALVPGTSVLMPETPQPSALVGGRSPGLCSV
jgi:hypothetical protein